VRHRHTARREQCVLHALHTLRDGRLQPLHAPHEALEALVYRV
jgi:hypothetical protein